MKKERLDELQARGEALSADGHGEGSFLLELVAEVRRHEKRRYEPMALPTVKESIEQIRQAAAERDDERAHALEIALYRRVVRECARWGHASAVAALETELIVFRRWTA